MTFTHYFQQFMDWWLQGLSYFCTPSIKRAMGLISDQITVEFSEEQVILKHYPIDSIEPLGIRSFNNKDEGQRISALQWLQEHQKKQAKVILVLPDAYILKKSFLFPSAAQSNLREALGFELNRRTPFTIEQAYFDYLIIGHEQGDNKASNKLRIELFVAPRQHVDPLLELLQEWDIHLDALKPASDYRDNSSVNLLPEEYRNNINHQTDHLTLFLASSVFLLFLAVLYLPITHQTQQLEKLEDEVHKNRNTALEVQQLKDQKQNFIEQISFLENKRKDTLSSVELLNEVTKIIPDDTWLTRLVIKNDELQIQGESSNASSLIQIVESSGRFSGAQFRSPVTQNNVSGKDKFHLSAKLITKLNTGLVKEEEI